VEDEFPEEKKSEEVPFGEIEDSYENDDFDEGMAEMPRDSRPSGLLV